MLLEVPITATHKDSIYVYTPGLLHFQYQFTVELVVRIVLIEPQQQLYSICPLLVENIYRWQLTITLKDRFADHQFLVWIDRKIDRWRLWFVMCCAFCTSTENDITHDSISLFEKRIVVSVLWISSASLHRPFQHFAVQVVQTVLHDDLRVVDGVKITTANNPPAKANATRYNTIYTL